MRIFLFFVVFGISTTALAEERPVSRLGSMLGNAELVEDLSTNRTVLKLLCGRDGIALNTSTNKADTPTGFFDNLDEVETRTLLLAQAPNGERAIFGYDGKSQNNSSGYLTHSFVPGSSNSSQLDGYASLYRFLTVYFSPDVKLTMQISRIFAGQVVSEIVSVSRSFDRSEILGKDQFERFRDVCQMAAMGDLDSLDPPSCDGDDKTIRNFRISVENGTDIFLGKYERGYSGTLLAYGADPKIKLSGALVDASKGSLELRLSDTLSIAYTTPSVAKADPFLNVLKLMAGTDTFSEAMKADPVMLEMRMPDGTVLSASDVTDREIRLPSDVFQKLEINDVISISGAGKNGTIEFSERIDLSGIGPAYLEMKAMLDAHRQVLDEAQACQDSDGDLTFIFAPVN